MCACAVDTPIRQPIDGWWVHISKFLVATLIRKLGCNRAVCVCMCVLVETFA